jgi:hypothetical protein
VSDLPPPVDMVDIFRNSDAAGPITDEVIANKDRLGVKVLWMQLGVINEEAKKRAEAAGLTVIMKSLSENRVWPVVGRDRLVRSQPAHDRQSQAGGVQRRRSLSRG